MHQGAVHRRLYINSNTNCCNAGRWNLSSGIYSVVSATVSICDDIFYFTVFSADETTEYEANYGCPV